MAHSHFQVFQNQTLRWTDGSPYAFQAWHNPLPFAVPGTAVYIVFQSTWREYDLSSPYLSSLQPSSDTMKHCTAMVRPTSAVGDLRWIKVPCHLKHADVSYLCKSRIAERPSSEDTEIVRSYLECTAKTLSFHGECIFFYTVALPLEYSVEIICATKTAHLWQVPAFIITKPVTSWSGKEQMLSTILKTMNHRWPSLIDYRSFQLIPADKILVQDYNNSRYKAFHFSKTSFSQWDVTDIELYKNGTSRGILHVACEALLVLTSGQCLQGHSACGEGTCILAHHVCDGVNDCPDLSDEASCDHVCFSLTANTDEPLDCYRACHPHNCTCYELYFHCVHGGCVPWSKICDGIPDCPNGEDELMCYFLVNNINSSVKVIQKSHSIQIDYDNCSRTETPSTCGVKELLEEDVPDRSYESDEALHHSASLGNGSTTARFGDTVLCENPEDTTCEKNVFGNCYPRHKHCLYETVQLEVAYCRNAAHLSSCKYHACPSDFKCPDAYCVPMHAVCNGKTECPNGEDELRCNKLSCPGFLLCRYDNVCVHPYEVWSGHVKCPLSGDDKALIHYTPCLFCTCLGNALLCAANKTPSGYIHYLLQRQQKVFIRSIIIRHIPMALDYTLWENSDSVFLLQLEISRSNLSFISKRSFSKLGFLKTLNLSRNSITRLSWDVFSNLKNLQTIDLSKNSITVFSYKLFAKNHMLRHINLNNNQLKNVGSCAFSGLHDLENLQLSHNQISEFRKDMFCFNATKLRVVDVSNNPIHYMKVTMLISMLHSLNFLNSTPLGLCCFFPNIKNCFPKSTDPKQVFTSSCRHLIQSVFPRVSYWAAGGGICLLKTALIGWFANIIRKNTNIKNMKNMYQILILILCISGWFRGFYFVSIATVNQFLENSNSYYEVIWQKHPACFVLNIFLYVSFIMELFLVLLIAGVRMRAVVFPFGAAFISVKGILISITVAFVVSFTFGSLAFDKSVGFYRGSEGDALGLALMLPGFSEEPWSWSLAAVFGPLSTMLVVFVILQSISLTAVLKSMGSCPTTNTSVVQKYRRSFRMTTITLVATVCAYSPLLAVHIVVFSGYLVKSGAIIGCILFTLSAVPILNACLYIRLKQCHL